MGTVTFTEVGTKSLRDADLKEKLQDLRQADNLTSWWYLFRTYLFLGLVIGGAVWLDQYRLAQGWGWLWSVPFFLLAIVLIGAGQHQLSALAHEAVHHILFRQRYLNELASDLLCLFPLFGSTHHYRLQHMAHHQFVNDPVRDPDVSQLKTSGHWLSFPLVKSAFLREVLKQLWLPNLFRFIMVRAAYNSTGTDRNPYLRKGWKPSKLPVRVGILYLFSLIGMLATLVWLEKPVLLAVVPLGVHLGVLAFYYSLPDRMYHQSRVHPVVSQRIMTLLRVSYIYVVWNALAWVTLLTGVQAAVYYFLLWLVPIFTSFAFFMILRQLVQHGNGDRGWLTNTRVFFVNRFISFSVFPLGQEYHLPHHMYASVPHYRLRRLHELLMEYPEYREQATVVEGYFLPRHRPPTHPTVLDVLGPDYAVRKPDDVHIDNSVLEEMEVEEKEQIIEEGEAEKRRLASLAGDDARS